MNILLTNLDVAVTSNDLKESLLQFGLRPFSVEVVFDKLSGKSKGEAIVGFTSEEDAAELVKNIYVIQGKQVQAQILKTL
jgi:RNA recognition motif-containing protein